MSWIEKTDEYFRSLRLWDLKIDECYLNITSDTDLFIYGLSDECDRCPYTKMANITPENGVIKINTAERLAFKFFTKNKGKYVFDNNATDLLCNEKPSLGEFGVYDIDTKSCQFKTALEPVNVNLSFLTVIALILAIIVIYKALIRAHQLFFLRQNREDSSDEIEPPIPPKPRLKSLDTFRGIAIVTMIFVNSGGGGYWWIEHATWNGLHIADLVFPWFIWIMGVCIPLSLRSQLNRNGKPLDIFLNILRRSITLFFVGVCLNSINGPTFKDLRIFGVLQRFGVAYFMVSTIHLFFIQSAPLMPQQRIKRILFDLILMIPHYLFIACVLALYLGLVLFLPIPGCPTAYFGPGGKHDNFSAPTCAGGATGYIDKLMLGSTHIYQHPTIKKVYESNAFDPEGLLGCLPTILQVVLGTQAGMILIHHSEPMERIKRWSTWSIITGLIALILCGFSKNNGWIPINKNLWSISFINATSSLAFILLSFCYIMIDVKMYWTDQWNPFLYPGMNAIIMYVGHTVMHKMLPWHWRIAYMNTHFIKLFENSWNTILWIFIAIYLYQKNIFYNI